MSERTNEHGRLIGGGAWEAADSHRSADSTVVSRAADVREAL